jgi:hypothetical protein
LSSRNADPHIHTIIFSKLMMIINHSLYDMKK